MVKLWGNRTIVQPAPRNESCERLGPVEVHDFNEAPIARARWKKAKAAGKHTL
jgi:hypothetical protein